jgi:hypothetical protein
VLRGHDRVLPCSSSQFLVCADNLLLHIVTTTADWESVSDAFLIYGRGVVTTTASYCLILSGMGERTTERRDETDQGPESTKPLVRSIACRAPDLETKRGSLD